MNDNVSLLDIANAAKDAPAAPPAPVQQAEIVPVQSAPLVGVTPAQPAPVTVQTPAVPSISINDLAGTAGTVAKAADPAMSVITDPNADINKQLEALNPQDRQAVLDKANGVNLLDPQIIQNYGSDVQRNSAQAAGQILEKVRSKDSGTAGELLQGMLVTIDKENLGEVSNIPLLGSLLNSANKLRRKYQKVEGQIDEIVDKLRVE